MLRSSCWLLLLVPLGPNVSVAQTHAAPVEGQRARVAYRCEIARDQPVACGEHRSPTLDTGWFRAVDRDTLRMRLQSSDAEAAIPTAYITQLWVADGTRTHFWAGAGIGLLSGALIGGIIGSTQHPDGSMGSLACSDDPATACGVILGAPAGFILGGVVGALIRTDRWRPVPLSHLRMSVGPRLDARALEVSVAF